jgi:hypothetical protein
MANGLMLTSEIMLLALTMARQASANERETLRKSGSGMPAGDFGKGGNRVRRIYLYLRWADGTRCPHFRRPRSQLQSLICS